MQWAYVEGGMEEGVLKKVVCGRGNPSCRTMQYSSLDLDSHLTVTLGKSLGLNSEFSRLEVELSEPQLPHL